MLLQYGTTCKTRHKDQYKSRGDLEIIGDEESGSYKRLEPKCRITASFSMHYSNYRLKISFNCNLNILLVRSFLQPPVRGVVLQSYGAGNGPDNRLGS